MQNHYTIAIEKMSPKLLVGECLDMAKIVLQELIQVYCSNNGYEFPIPNNVLSLSISPMICSASSTTCYNLRAMKKSPKVHL